MADKADEYSPALSASAESSASIQSVNRTPAASQRRSTRQMVSYVILLGLVSSHFALAYLMNTHQQFNLHDYLNGKAPQPYQYRALPAWILSLMSNTTLARSISAQLPAPFSDPEQLMFLLLVAISMAGMIEITRRCILAVTSDREFAMIFAFLTPIAAYITYVSIANSYRLAMAYDMPALMLFGWAYYFILRSNSIGFSIAFFFATLARDTSVFLIIVYICQRWTNLPSLLRRDGLRLTFLAATYAVIMLFLYSLYGQNPVELATSQSGATGIEVPGGFFVIQVGHNLENLVSPIYGPSILSFVGWLWLPVLLGWRRLDHPGIRRTLLVLPPLWFVAVLIAGRITEVRVFGEMIWFFVMGVAIIARNWLTEHGYGNRVTNSG
jgi:hypothetical protein